MPRREDTGGRGSQYIGAPGGCAGSRGAKVVPFYLPRTYPISVGPLTRDWGHARVWWQTQADPTEAPAFVLDDPSEGEGWVHVERLRGILQRSLQTLDIINNMDLPGALGLRHFVVCIFIVVCYL